VPDLAAVERVDRPHVVGSGRIQNAATCRTAPLMVPPVNSRVPTPPMIVGGTPPRGPVRTRVIQARVRFLTFDVLTCFSVLKRRLV
jgi:hypothetical protein